MRFDQPVYSTVHFSEEILVKCPACAAIGTVKTQLGQYLYPRPIHYATSFSCSNCNLKKDNDQEWFGYYIGRVKRACGFCGTMIDYTSKPTKVPYEDVNLECGTCKREIEYLLQWSRARVPYPVDPYLGIALWLQTEVKGKQLWCYNLEHLSYLRDYVAAKVREDHNRHKYSLISNLPGWVKSAKNRKLIVRKLNKLETNLVKALNK